MFKEIAARETIYSRDFIINEFSNLVRDTDVIDIMNFNLSNVIAFSGLKRYIPILRELFKNKNFLIYVDNLIEERMNLLFLYKNESIKVYAKKKEIREINIPYEIVEAIKEKICESSKWGGFLNENGEHIINLKFPKVGSHYAVNLLMGNRIGYDNTLQTTPKSVVDMFGRGSFRSHADRQVLATRWDLMPDENGFPANRQFYLYEGCKKIFYSAEIDNENIVEAICKHSQNYTTIYYKLRDGLEVERLIFILPHDKNFPLATEVQRIKVINNSARDRKIRIVYTGMFGSPSYGAMYEDVVYSNLIMQSKIIQNNNDLIAIIPDYYPNHCRDNTLFHCSLLHYNNRIYFPKEFGTNYNEFIGNGTLENPENGIRLNNNLNRKGPGFFVNAIELNLKSKSFMNYDNFTGLIDSKNEDVKEKIKHLVDTFSIKNNLENNLDKNILFYNKYKNYVQINSSDDTFDTFFNNNLPFQILYQTFMSRSFSQTQKGYREIGFREIQDLFASMNYFIASDNGELVKYLIKQWAKNVYKMGFSNHNFYWVGKEAGIWSDDSLWLVNAVYRYFKATGDVEFLKEEINICGTDDEKRPLIDTLNEIIVYSSEISIGKNDFPLIDYADWNDCLKVDKNNLSGFEKEKLYLKQLKLTGKSYGERLENNSPESVMNAFLLKVAVDNMEEIYIKIGDKKNSLKMTKKSRQLYKNLNERAWKKDYFVRVLFNKNNKIEYLGSEGDGFSSNKDIKGTYFLNSFSWAVLSSAASDEQIESMIYVIEKYLKTDYGFKLVTEANLSKVSEFTATDEYFYGDRENGAVFKHAAMMAVTAMFKSAKKIKNKKTAEKLTDLAYWMLDLAVPFKTINNPFEIFGNPRFCTQYNNSETGENMGPILSGTATWLNLSIMEALGFEACNNNEYILDPILRIQDKVLQCEINKNGFKTQFKIKKDNNFRRIIDDKYKIYINGKLQEKIKLDGKKTFNKVELIFV